MPLGSFLAFSVAVVPLFRGRNRKVGHGAAGLRETDFGIFAQIANQDNFVHRHMHLHLPERLAGPKVEPT
jgi:hypothetical protein